jgi:DNA-binding FadR family transcriptional regulator
MSEIRFSQVVAPKTAALIADSLRADVHSGRLRPGDRLAPEDQLQVAFGVSRPTLREAIRILEHDEVIEVRRGAHGGAIVRVPTIRPLSRALADLIHLGPAAEGGAPS